MTPIGAWFGASRLAVWHQRAGMLARGRRFGLIAARSIGEAVVGDMSVHSVVPVQGIGGACTFFEASVPSGSDTRLNAADGRESRS